MPLTRETEIGACAYGDIARCGGHSDDVWRFATDLEHVDPGLRGIDRNILCPVRVVHLPAVPTKPQRMSHTQADTQLSLTRSHKGQGKCERDAPRKRLVQGR